VHWFSFYVHLILDLASFNAKFENNGGGGELRAELDGLYNASRGRVILAKITVSTRAGNVGRYVD
jgi:hypothetical protein